MSVVMLALLLDIPADDRKSSRQFLSSHAKHRDSVDVGRSDVGMK